MSDKLHISWDEVQSADVDQKLVRQNAAARTTEHYRQQIAPTMASMTGRGGRQSIWYNTLLYMTVFGLIGGVIAWAASELVHRKVHTDIEQFQDFLVEGSKLFEQANKGEISMTVAEKGIEDLKKKFHGNPYVELLSDKTQSIEEVSTKRDALIAADKIRMYLKTIIFTAVAGLCMACALSVAEPFVSRNWRGVVINGSVAMCLGLVGGTIVGLFINQVYQALAGDQHEVNARQIFARAVGWAILGLFLAVSPGIVMRSGKKLAVGLAGGFIGGIIGGALFDLIAMTLGAASVSRFVSIVAIGTVAGLGTGVIENVVKTGWLKVTGGMIAGKQFILYKNPTLVGSSPQCEIYLFKDTQVAPQHAAIRQVPQGYEIQDLGTVSGTFVNGAAAKRTRLKNGDQIQIGGTSFAFQEKSRS